MNPYRHKTPAACLVALVLALAGATQANADSIVQVDLEGGGSGRVEGQEGIDCPGTCWADMAEFFEVVRAPAGLYATADPGSIFAGWGGACLLTGSSPKCAIPEFYNATRKAIAHFERLPILRPAGLTVSVAGTGAGTVAAPGIACPGDCAQGYVSNATVSLTATPAAGSSFAGWSGDCAGMTSPCSVNMSGAKSVTATFSADPTQPGANPGAAPAPRDDCTIRGTRGNDILAGTSGRDVICGLAGRDRLIGRAGNDVLRGGAGGDLLRGGRGRDLLNGGAGVDRARIESRRDMKKSIERVL